MKKLAKTLALVTTGLLVGIVIRRVNNSKKNKAITVGDVESYPDWVKYELIKIKN